MACGEPSQPVKTEAPETQTEDAHLGKINIDITCSEEAFPVFQEGLLLLHSFQFSDAAEKFQEAQALDEACAMAYWGEAMSENHPLWREQDKEQALAILARLGEDVEQQRSKFKTPFEQDLFDAVRTLYGSGTKKENDQAYAKFMEGLNQKYPDNHEIRAFYALSLLGAIEDDRQAELYEKGAQIAQSIIDENPQHPGALHYLIHSYDDPENAPKALEAANRYAKVAPDAAHALHMPSHIYVAMGMWDEVISSNEAAVAASIERQERKKLDLKTIDFHSLKWLMYGHLQKGEFDQARVYVKQMEDYCKREPTKRAKSHTIMMKAAYLTETGKWDDPLLKDDIDYSDLSVQVDGTRSYMLGMAAYQNKDQKALQEIIKAMTPKIADAEKEALKAGSAMCSGSYNRSRPTNNQVNRTKVVQLQLQALAAIMENKTEEVDQLLQAAVQAEEATTYKFGPPEIVKPSPEMYAEWLVLQGRKEEALDQYEVVLERAPGRYIVVNGIKKLKEES